MLRRFTTLLMLAGMATLLRAQDLHFSQFYHNPQQLNPAQTGMFRGEWRAMGLYRSQWTTVPVSYQTIALAADKQFLRRGANLLSAGLLLQHDKAGDAGLRWTQVGLSGSVAHQIADRQALSVGFGLAFVQRAFDIAGLKFKNQWTGDLYDPALPNKETFNQSSGLAPTFSAGLNWFFAPAGTRTQANAGAAVFHLNRPKVSFRDNPDERLPLRLAFSANGAVQINDFLDLVVFGVAQSMGKAQEVVAGGGARFWVLPNETALQLTLATRLGDALIPAIQYERGDWTVGLSYDWNTSDFDVATRHRGGVELAAVYRPVPAPPVKAFKSCPVF